MINHVSIGVRDIAASKRFYDAVFAALGYKAVSESEDSLSYGEAEGVFFISRSQSPVPADMESGLHFCFDAPNRASIDAFHAAALKTGGRDNGKPGLRPDYSDTYYAAFVIDPDGYRLEAYYGKPA